MRSFACPILALCVGVCGYLAAAPSGAGASAAREWVAVATTAATIHATPRPEAPGPTPGPAWSAPEVDPETSCDDEAQPVDIGPASLGSGRFQPWPRRAPVDPDAIPHPRLARRTRIATPIRC